MFKIENNKLVEDELKYAFEKYSNKLTDIYVILFGRPIFENLTYLIKFISKRIRLKQYNKRITIFNSEYFEEK